MWYSGCSFSQTEEDSPTACLSLHIPFLCSQSFLPHLPFISLPLSVSLSVCLSVSLSVCRSLALVTSPLHPPTSLPKQSFITLIPLCYPSLHLPPSSQPIQQSGSSWLAAGHPSPSLSVTLLLVSEQTDSSMSKSIIILSQCNPIPEDIPNCTTSFLVPLTASYVLHIQCSCAKRSILKNKIKKIIKLQRVSSVWRWLCLHGLQ